MYQRKPLPFTLSFFKFLFRMTSVAANGREGGDADVWIDLQSGLRDVFDRNPMTPKRYMELYS